ncbi:MAG: HPr kinase/phosphorylase [Betaproteobacteria bacterium]|nr:HPr kinase/phosphorylase [Betaproteobacteria bacterium]
MLQVNVTRLHDDNRAALQLAWIAGQDGSAAVKREAAASAALIGHLNLTHPNSIQVLGAYKASMFSAFAPEARTDFVAKLFAGPPAVVIVADGVAAPAEVLAAAHAGHTPLFATPLAAPRVIEALSRYLAKALADSTTRHGVLMDVLGLGVLITGESGVGKSELGLELISRGHGLVADDVVEISRIAIKTLEGRCPPMLKDFIEVRGLGLLNVRTIFGETAVRPKMRLKLIVHLAKPAAGGIDVERLPLADQSEDILGLTVRKVVIPVAAGRNLAVLLEAAVRNHILQLRGIDSTAEFLARQRAAIEKDED